MCIHETVRDKLLKNRSKRALLKKENKPKQAPYAHEPPIFQPRPAPCPFQPRPKVACFARSRFRRLFPSELRASPSDPSPCADAQSPRHTQRPQSSPKTRFSSRSTPDPAKNYNWAPPTSDVDAFVCGGRSDWLHRNSRTAQILGGEGGSAASQ